MRLAKAQLSDETLLTAGSPSRKDSILTIPLTAAPQTLWSELAQAMDAASTHPLTLTLTGLQVYEQVQPRQVTYLTATATVTGRFNSTAIEETVGSVGTRRQMPPRRWLTSHEVSTVAPAETLTATDPATTTDSAGTGSDTSDAEGSTAEPAQPRPQMVRYLESSWLGAQAGLNDVHATWDPFGNGVDPMADDGTTANTAIRDTVQLRNPALNSMPATSGPTLALILPMLSCLVTITLAGIALCTRRD